MKITKKEEKIRRALADYMFSEGCSCCRDSEQHDKNKATLAKLLKVPMNKKETFYDLTGFRTNMKQ